MGAVRPHILVVDDLADAADSLVILLTIWGYDAEAHYAAASALDAARARRPDVVILDLGMPGVDGYRMALHLREVPGCEDTPMVAVTGYETGLCRARARDVGVDHYLVKPVDLVQLGALLARLVGPSTAPAPRAGAARTPDGVAVGAEPGGDPAWRGPVGVGREG